MPSRWKVREPFRIVKVYPSAFLSTATVHPSPSTSRSALATRSCATAKWSAPLRSSIDKGPLATRTRSVSYWTRASSVPVPDARPSLAVRQGETRVNPASIRHGNLLQLNRNSPTAGGIFSHAVELVADVLQREGRARRFAERHGVARGSGPAGGVHLGTPRGPRDQLSRPGSGVGPVLLDLEDDVALDLSGIPGADLGEGPAPCARQRNGLRSRGKRRSQGGVVITQASAPTRQHSEHNDSSNSFYEAHVSLLRVSALCIAATERAEPHHDVIWPHAKSVARNIAVAESRHSHRLQRVLQCP